MKVLNQTQVSQVSGGAEKDPTLGLFPTTGIKLIDDIHRMEWNLYGKFLFGWLIKS